MNRRILLIDPDPEFRANLAQQLGRYRFDVVANANAEEAIADAVAMPPVLILLAAETDKVGFKTFGKIKKSSLAKTTIILATRSLAPEDIAKHRAMRVHADEYLDKRTMRDDELLYKIDNLIGLGEPDDLDIPVEIDDIAMNDGDMVLDETVGEDDPAPMNTVADGRDQRFDQIVSEETDAAFDALLGFGDEPIPEPVARPRPPAHDHEEPEISQISDPTPPPEPAIDESIPAPILDGKRVDLGSLGTRLPVEEEERFDTFSTESIKFPVPEPSLGVAQAVALQPEPEPEPEPVVSEPAIIVNHRFESSPAIVLDADDLQPIEEDSGGVPEPVPHPASQRDVDETPPPSRRPPTRDLAISAAAAVAAVEPAPPVRPTRQIVDLGLDAIADAAESEQSGVYDRRALRKINELERQISQLKTELERQRASVEAPARGSREREFVNLRQQLAAKDEDARRIRTELDARTRELADAEDRGRQAAHAKMTLEARAAELEQRAAADGARASSLETRERTLIAQIAALEHDVDNKGNSLASAETSRTQLERDLATERAMRAASTSEAERALRVEREQMIARHQGELGALRQEHAGALAIAIEKQRQDHAAAAHAQRGEHEARVDVIQQQLDTLRQQIESSLADHAAALDGVRREREAAIDTARQERESQRAEHVTALDAARRERDKAVETARELAGVANREQASALEGVKKEHAAALERARAEYTAALEAAVAAVRTEHVVVLDQARGEHAGALQALQHSHATAIEQLRHDHSAAIQGVQGEHATQLASLEQELDARGAAAVEATRQEIASEAERALGQLEAQHAGDVERFREEHAAQLAQVTGHANHAIAERDAAIAKLRADHSAIEEQYALALERVQVEAQTTQTTLATSHERALAEVRGEVERARTELANVQSASERMREQLAADHAAELAQQANQHAATLTERERELARQRQDEAIAHTAALAELKVELDKQAKLHGIKLDGAQKELDDVLALHDHARQQLVVDQKRIAEEQAAAHAAELAAVGTERQRALEEIQRTQAEHRAALERAAAQHRDEIAQTKELSDREISEYRSALLAAKRTMEETAARHHAEREALEREHEKAVTELKGQHERALAVVNGEVIKVKAFGDAEHNRAMAAKDVELDKQRKELAAEHARVVRDLTGDRDELQRGLSAARDTIKRSETELATAVQTIADRNAELRTHAAAIAERDQRLADLRKEIETLETENTGYQEQVLRAYQKIKADEVKSARAKKAMAIALTALDEEAAKTESS